MHLLVLKLKKINPHPALRIRKCGLHTKVSMLAMQKFLYHIWYPYNIVKVVCSFNFPTLHSSKL